VHAHFLDKMNSSAETYGKVDTIYYEVMSLPFLSPKEAFCACVVERSLGEEEKKKRR